jgi:tight adherence protein C
MGILAVVFLLVFIAVLLLVWALKPAGQAEKTRVALDRLDSYDTRAFRQSELAIPLEDRLLGPAFDHLSGASRLITPQGRIRRLEEKVEQAGRPWNLDVNGLLAIKLLSLFGGLIALVILASLDLLSAGWFLLLAAAVVVGSYYLPDAILYFWIKERKRRIARALPDFLDLLTVTVEAGLGLDSAMLRISEKMRDPMREEILITIHHMRIGQSRETALKEFARRCDVRELDSFVSTLIQSQRLGVSMGQVLRTQSESMRVERRQRIEEAARKAPVKMLFPLVLCIFPALFVVIIGPALMRIYDVLVK